MSKQAVGIAVFWVLVALLAAPPVLAQSPARIPVSGTLTDAAGAPVDGQREVVFKLYTDGGGQAEVWSEPHSVAFDRGYFAEYLGTTTPVDLSVFRNYPAVYLGVTVGDDAEMPLVELATAPYAAYATFCGDASAIGGVAYSQLVDTIVDQLPDTNHARYSDDEARAAMGALADANPLHHARYSPSDAVAAMGAVGDGNSLNHARYTDGEAVSAMGPVGDGNALAHDRYTDAEAVSAMGPAGNGNALAHDRYTNAEAVAAVGPHNVYTAGAGLALNNGQFSLNPSATCLSRIARYEATCAAQAVAGSYTMYAVVSPLSSGTATGTNGNAICNTYVGNNGVTNWGCLSVPYVYDYGANWGDDVRPTWSGCATNHGAGIDSYPWFDKTACTGVMMACCVHN